MRLILLVNLSVCTMDRKNADIVGTEAPNGKCMAEASNAGSVLSELFINICREDSLPLAICLGFEVRSTCPG